ncbi:hypothetical protein DPEC_G00084350 [Dallia pectoralis]|uniref:Uncharacterized protein n=1 Tax=Dallia pectoralis TaxID=75939 RepID=A0ACC2H0C7_DALPE|nr:hypothetical protein DPEC_G00084350 [Dallia pectoralis]
MENEHVSLNAYNRKMPSLVCSYVDEAVRSNLSEGLDKVETPGTDFIQDVREATTRRIRTPDMLLEAHIRRVEMTGSSSKDPVDGHGFRKTTAVDVLRRNFGSTRCPNANSTSPDDQRDPQGAITVVESVLNERINCATVDESSSGEARDGNTEGFTSTGVNELDDARDSGCMCDSSRADDEDDVVVVHLKEHVYCTVYCIANDNYRKPADDTSGRHYNGAMTASTSTVVADPSSDLRPQSDLETGLNSAPEPYSLSDLIGPRTLGSLYSVDYSVWAVVPCRVCLDSKHIKPLHCCKQAVCEECLKRYISSQVMVGRAVIVCPITECRGYLEENLVVSYLGSEEVAKYKYFLELSRIDSTTKPCPQCSQFTSLDGPTPSRAEHKYKILCVQCQFLWCFKCHAPWHEGLKCRDYRKGDKLLRTWASVIEHGQRNAQKCPRCKIHIQRTEGCDHMNCTQCNTNFCYRCGERYRHLRFFGDHTSNLSVFGCRYRYHPDKPHLRRLVRGSVCVSKLLVAPVLLVLVAVVGAFSLVIGLVAFPIYYICKKRRKRSQGTGSWL